VLILRKAFVPLVMPDRSAFLLGAVEVLAQGAALPNAGALTPETKTTS
jgi:hypothetical protein